MLTKKEMWPVMLTPFTERGEVDYNALERLIAFYEEGGCSGLFAICQSSEVFYLSLEDDLMRLFGSDKLMSMFNALGVPENEQIEHKMLSTAIEKAQKKIETNNYGIRENLLKYDEVMNEQREVIYAERLQVLNGENMRDVICLLYTSPSPRD